MRRNLGKMLITASPTIAKYAEECGVERIFVDMETLGKHERQKHLSAHTATHNLEDVAAIASVLKKSELMVRINPIHTNTPYEIDSAIANGAQRLMLPMFRRPEEVRYFLELIDGRVSATLLAETIQAVSRLSTYIGLLRTRDEVYFGLNDLSLDMGLNYLFEPLAARTFELSTKLLLEKNIKFGFGGIACLGSGELPAEWVLSEHVRLGSSWVILSRAFHGSAKNAEELANRLDLAKELHKLNETEQILQNKDNYLLESNRIRLEEKVFEIARGKWSNE